MHWRSLISICRQVAPSSTERQNRDRTGPTSRPMQHSRNSPIRSAETCFSSCELMATQEVFIKRCSRRASRTMKSANGTATPSHPSASTHGSSWIVAYFRGLERGKDLLANCQRIEDRLNAGCEFLPFIVAEI